MLMIYGILQNYSMGRNGVFLVWFLSIGTYLAVPNYYAKGSLGSECNANLPENSNNPSIKNNPPSVKILLPKENTSITHEHNIVYQIEVNDSEDGSTLYNEIPADEVFLEVTYLKDTIGISFLKNTMSEHLGLNAIKENKCFNCHMVDTKLIGPAFLEIKNRYPLDRSSIKKLSQNVIKSSSGIWGSSVMPSHPDLDDIQAENMVEWILSANIEPLKAYYKGTHGSFPVSTISPGKQIVAILLTATYTDHGVEDQLETRQTGWDKVLIWKN